MKRFLLWLLLAGVSFADPTFHIGGAVGHAHDWTCRQVRETLAGQVKTVYYDYRGAHHSAACVPLWAVLEGAAPQGKSLDDTVVVEGTDGYQVTFSLGELDPKFGNEPVWLALDEDGAPLPEALSPTRLIIPGDVKLGRWVHNVVRLRVVAR
ncbi:MAG TPA: hypothetical protein VGO93_01180 [Candidatus Xenobia bacterium]|jgi:hypothetical protein